MTSPQSDEQAPSADQGRFAELGLAPRLCSAVLAAGYDTPTPIQLQSIPHVLKGRDLLGCAQTGTGKTAAFALPILQRLTPPQGTPGRRRPPPILRALVLAPTRELAAQIGASFGKYGQGSKLRHSVIFGGVGKNPQIGALRRGLDIVVATPGRLLDLMNDGYVDLSAVDHLVLDEADRMLDMGFIRDVRRIVREIPRERQTLLFSATMPTAIRDLSRTLLRDPKHVAVDPISSTVEPISQAVYFVEKTEKTDLLLQILADKSIDIDRALVFTRTKHGANRLSTKLERAGVRAAAIHGNKSQGARERALKSFKDGELRCLVATDIAARGIDIKELSHVVNFDLPNEPESYVHRVGRTGRAGLAGAAISFCATDERPYLRSIERLTARQLDRVNGDPEGGRRPSRQPARSAAPRNGTPQPRQGNRDPRHGSGQRSEGGTGGRRRRRRR